METNSIIVFYYVVSFEHVVWFVLLFILNII